MSALSLRRLTKVYKNGTFGVRDLNVEVTDGELMVLVGPSGSGKSTTLRLIAGLESPTSGEILIGGSLANDISARDRDIAMVFQDYALYPHLNVERNLGFGLKMRGFGKEEIASRVREAAHVLGIVDLLSHRPRELSGGQRQRVALGRALVRKPRVFLFDEPLSNLDASLRVQLRREIKEIHSELAATMVYVTHDQSEAMAMGQRIAVMSQGIVEQAGSPTDLYRMPENVFVASFLGNPSMNLLECAYLRRPDGLEFRSDECSLFLRPRDICEFDNMPQRVTVGFRAEDVALGTVPEHGLLAGLACITSIEAIGAETLVYLESGNWTFVARVLGFSDVGIGDEISYAVPEEKLHFFDGESQKRIQS